MGLFPLSFGMEVVYEGEILELLNLGVLSLHRTSLRARARADGDAESKKLSTRRGFSSDGTLPRSQSRAE